MINIFLRDCSALGKGNKKWDKKDPNYIFQSVKRAILFAKKFDINFQLTIEKNFFLKNENYFYHHINDFKKIGEITIHLHTDYDHMIDYNEKTINFIKKINNFSKNLDNITGFCIHPDNVINYKILYDLLDRKNNSYIAIETTDANARSGNKFKQIKDILEENKFLKLVLDTAHIRENLKEKEPNFIEYCKFFYERIIEIHTSQEGNFYKFSSGIDKFKTSHSLLCLGAEDIINDFNVMPKFKNLNLTIEGVIPYGDYGNNLLIEEIILFKKIARLISFNEK